MDKLITALGYKNFITEMSYALDCVLEMCTPYKH